MLFILKSYRKKIQMRVSNIVYINMFLFSELYKSNKVIMLQISTIKRINQIIFNAFAYCNYFLLIQFL